MPKKLVYQHRQEIHPIDACPFEALYNGSWCNVDYFRIKDGKIITHFEHHGFITEEKVPVDSLRIRSRKANLSDCTCFLRPGVDVCVFSSDQTETDSCQESLQPAWIDAKVHSIERQPHELRCTCRFYVSLKGVHQQPLHTEKKMVNGEIRELFIDNIAILQQLDRKPCEDGYFRWISSKDCPSKDEAKLFRVQFMYDVSWLLVASTLKGVEFEITSSQNKMLYGILDGNTDMFACRFDKIVKAINFKIEGGILRPSIRTFVPGVPVEPSVTDEIIKMVPVVDMEEDGWCNLSPHYLIHLRRSGRRNVQPERYVSDGGFVKVKSCVAQAKIERIREWENGESSGIILSESDSDCSIHSHCSEHTSTACKRPLDDEVLGEQVQQSNYVSKRNYKRVKSSVRSPNSFSDDPLPAACDDNVLNQQGHVVTHNEKVSRLSSKRVKSGSEQRKNMSWKNKKYVEKRLKKTGSGKEFRSKHFFRSREKVRYGVGTYKRTILTKSEYNEIIDKFMKNIDSEIAKYQQPAVCQWEEIISKQRWKFPRTPPSDDLVENPELEDLWKEMEISMSLQFHEEYPTDAEGVVHKSSVDDGQPCQHNYVLNEQIGTICRLCSSVGTEIRYILPSFLESPGRTRNMEYEQIKFEGRHVDDLELDTFFKDASSRNISIHEDNESVWTLIPDLQKKLHAHQKNAFEFLWKNIAGSLMPEKMDASIARTGGCIISHSPGAGKTLLIISFLASFLKLFPGKRPLILAPKTTLHTWLREFKKWEVSVPIYQIHARRNYKKELQNKKMRTSPRDFKMNKDVMHTVDCLEKFSKWHEHASVLLMSYPSFLSIMRGNSVFRHWRYMAGILRQNSGLLILDEGHNPRSTNSILRKTLMQVKTDQRILLSGTLFQNNFKEYFNTLCLARPGFISEVLRKLDKIPSRNQYGKDCTKNYREIRARKFFIEEIANKINSKEDRERRKGLNMLKKITNGFIDVYESGSSHRLPGLKSYKLLIKPTVIQQEFLATLQNNEAFRRFHLELELLVTFVSIHPWLLKTIPYSDQYYSLDELKKIEHCKLDLRIGSKVRFVVNLVRRCVIKGEKVLIFCRYISPIKLFVEIFENIFGWTKGDEVLVLFGEQELFDRSKVIDKFEEPGGSSQVLIASISACSEGISLTAASRVVLLDSEWNPSKTKQAIARAFRPGQEKVVYVYHLFSSGSLEEDKYGRNTWKERVSRMISVGAGTEDTSCRQAEDVDDEVLKEILEDDHGQLIHMITKDDKLSGFLGR